MFCDCGYFQCWLVKTKTISKKSELLKGIGLQKISYFKQTKSMKNLKVVFEVCHGKLSAKRHWTSQYFFLWGIAKKSFMIGFFTLAKSQRKIFSLWVQQIQPTIFDGI